MLISLFSITTMASFLPSLKRRSGTFHVNQELPSFVISYMGCVPSEVKSGQECTKNIVDNLSTALKGQTLPKLTVSITTKGIGMKGQKKGTDDFIPIYAITYGAADSVHKRVFSFIESREQGPNGRKFYCHAFMCRDATSCRVMILYLMKSFNIAYEEYLRDKKRKNIQSRIENGPKRSSSDEPEPAYRNTIGTQTETAVPLAVSAASIARVSDWLERCVHLGGTSPNGYHGNRERQFSEFERRERELTNPEQLNSEIDLSIELKDPVIQSAIQGFAASLYPSDPPPPYKEFEDDPDEVFHMDSRQCTPMAAGRFT
ncbi:low density lipoprotein receptor adapter protein 1-like [Saccoglossus kowalevskii]